MSQLKNSKSSDDDILFAEETRETPRKAKNWKLIIIDDEQEVHTMTRLVLSDYKFQGSFLEFISGYSGADARRIISEHPDAACLLLDVVMETPHAGLDVVKHIREEVKNKNLRIILRTGQPGKAPEKKIILDYDINDYKEKTELTSQKLFTTVTTAIRSYIHLQHLEKKQKQVVCKNTCLNQEIARRVVAEANLEKYNKSLERMIENKSNRLKESLEALETIEKKLKAARNFSDIGRLASKATLKIEAPVDNVRDNLKTIENYRANITRLIEQYEILLVFIHRHAKTFSKKALKTLDQIADLKKSINLEQTLTTYPDIISQSLEEMDQIKETLSAIQKFIHLKKEPRQKVTLNPILDKILETETKKRQQPLS